MSRFASITPAVSVAVGVSLVGGGLAGAVFTWLVHQSSPALVTYSITTTSTGTDSPLVKGLVPNLKLKIGDEDIPVVYTHAIELATVGGEYVEAAEVAITFPSPLRILGFDALAPSPVHHIDCKKILTGLTCRIAPLSVGNQYRVNIAADKGAIPHLITSSRNAELIALDRYLFLQSHSAKAWLFSKSSILTFLVGCFGGVMFAFLWRLIHAPLSLVGKLVDTSGTPIVGAAIQVVLKEPEGKAHSYKTVVTDEHGDFLCGGLRKQHSIKGQIHVQHTGYKSMKLTFESPIILAVLDEHHKQAMEYPLPAPKLGQ